jgi:hypothetical protein
MSKLTALRERAGKSKWVCVEKEDLIDMKEDLIDASCLRFLRVLDLRTRKERKWIWMTRAAE